MEELNFVTVKAIDVSPMSYGLYCSVGNYDPFVNPICHRSWSECGTKIWFMLDSHNFISALPDEELKLVKLNNHSRNETEQKKFLAARYDERKKMLNQMLNQIQKLATSKNMTAVCKLIEDELAYYDSLIH